MTPRGRPRDPEIDEKVTKATLELLKGNGYGGLRMDEIARVSGVAKTTIYRRWPSLASLAVDSVATNIDERTFTPTADPIADLKKICERLVASIDVGSASWLGVALDLQQQQDEVLREHYRKRIIEPPRLMLLDALTRVQEAGCLSSAATPERWTDFLIGAAIYRVVMLHDSVTPHDIAMIIDDIIIKENLPAKKDSPNPAIQPALPHHI